MRRTFTALMFLAVGGLAFAAQAADHSRGNSNWQYYSANQNSYKISDEDEAAEAQAQSSGVVNAAGTAPTTRQEKNALFTSAGSIVGNDIAQASYFSGGGSCGCQSSCNSCNSCVSNCCDCDCAVNSFRLEWLGWFTRGRNTPPLVTTSNAQDGGVLGAPSTDILYGADPIGTNLRNGGRLTLSHLFDDGITSGTMRFWGIEDGSTTFAANSSQFPVLAIPFFNVTLGQNDAYLVASPNVTDPGSVRVTSKNDLIGADAWVSRYLYNDCSGSLQVLGGYQFARFDDTLQISSDSVVAGPNSGGLPVGSTLSTFDSFRTQNEFHGASSGLLVRSYRGLITLEGLAKVAAGNMRQTVITSGSSTITPFGGSDTTSAGMPFDLSLE